MAEADQLTLKQLEAGLDEIRRSPKRAGVLKLIVRRPRPDHREVLEEGELDLMDGLLGDGWRRRGSSRKGGASADPETQLTIMNSRVAALVAQSMDRWQLAGDQLFVALDLSAESLPPTTRLALGSAVIEVTGKPHSGCKKFSSRFGLDALRFVNSPLGRQLRLRGVNARVIQPGVIRVGDVVANVRYRHGSTANIC